METQQVGGGLYGGYSGDYLQIGFSGSGSGGSGYIGNALLENKGMYGYKVTNSDDVDTKTTSTTNVSNVATANYAKAGDRKSVV